MLILKFIYLTQWIDMPRISTVIICSYWGVELMHDQMIYDEFISCKIFLSIQWWLYEILLGGIQKISNNKKKAVYKILCIWLNIFNMFLFILLNFKKWNPVLQSTA